MLTTHRAAPDLRATVPAATEVVAVNDGDWVDPAGAVAALRARGHEHVLSEGGPTLFTSFVAAGQIDELFLTVSPLLAGRVGRAAPLACRRRGAPPGRPRRRRARVDQAARQPPVPAYGFR